MRSTSYLLTVLIGGQKVKSSEYRGRDSRPRRPPLSPRTVPPRSAIPLACRARHSLRREPACDRRSARGHQLQAPALAEEVHQGGLQDRQGRQALGPDGGAQRRSWQRQDHPRGSARALPHRGSRERKQEGGLLSGERPLASEPHSFRDVGHGLTCAVARGARLDSTLHEGARGCRRDGYALRSNSISPA